MFDIPKFNRPAKALLDGLASVGTATASSELYKMGIRNPVIAGAVPHSRGKVIAGPALTLQFMPKREDLYGDDEYADREKQLHRHALYHVEADDVVVVDARGDIQSGIFGEMMLTYFAGKGGAGMVIDGVIRDAAKAFALDIGYWMRGVSPNFHTQTTLMPHAVNVPIACGGTYVRQATSSSPTMTGRSASRSPMPRGCSRPAAIMPNGRTSRASCCRRAAIFGATIRSLRRPKPNTRRGRLSNRDRSVEFRRRVANASPAPGCNAR